MGLGRLSGSRRTGRPILAGHQPIDDVHREIGEGPQVRALAKYLRYVSCGREDRLQ